MVRWTDHALAQLRHIHDYIAQDSPHYAQRVIDALVRKTFLLNDLPPQQGQSSATAMLGQLGSFAGAAGGALDIKNPNDLYIGMMKSRTLTDNLDGCRHNAAEHLVYASRSKALFRFAKAILAGEPIQTFNHANEPCRYRAHETRT